MKSQKNKLSLNLMKTTITKLDNKAQRSVMGGSDGDTGVGNQGDKTKTGV